MTKYLLIESRDPFDSRDVNNHYGMAADLVKAGNEVTLFLVQNGVVPARPTTESAPLSELAAAGVEILADDFSLRERGIDANALTKGVSAAPLDAVIDQMAEGRKTLWQ